MGGAQSFKPAGAIASNDPIAMGSPILGDPNAVPTLGGPVGGQFNPALWNYDPLEHLNLGNAFNPMGGFGGGGKNTKMF